MNNMKTAKDVLIDNIPNIYRAKLILDLKFDRIIRHQTPGVYSNQLSPIYYFMVGNTDIAYYVDIMNYLFIHAKPREWDKSILEQFTTFNI